MRSLTLSIHKFLTIKETSVKLFLSFIYKQFGKTIGCSRDMMFPWQQISEAMFAKFGFFFIFG